MKEFGYALTYDNLVHTDCNSSLCFKPLEPSLESSLVIVWKKYQVFPKAAKKFLIELQDEIKIELKNRN